MKHTIFLLLTIALVPHQLYSMDSEYSDGAWDLAKKHPVFTAGVFAAGMVSCVGLLVVHDLWRAMQQKRQWELKEKSHDILMTTSNEKEIQEALKAKVNGPISNLDYLNGRLTQAARDGKIEDVVLCLKCGAQPLELGWSKREDKSGSSGYCFTPLEAAVNHDHADIFGLFVRQGIALPNQIAEKSLLLALIEKKAIKIATYLLNENMVDPNEGAEDGQPIHEVIRIKSSDLLSLLLTKGAQVNALALPRGSKKVDDASHGYTALDLARTYRWEEGKKLLLAAGAKTAKQLRTTPNK